MLRYKLSKFAACLIVAAGFATNAVSANLVTNGSFETFTGTFGSDGAVSLPAGNTQLTGWTVVGNEIAVIKNANDYGLAASDGSNFLDIIGYGNGFGRGVSQGISGLTIGENYVFSMDLGISNGRPFCGGTCGGPVSAIASIADSNGNITKDGTFTQSSALPGNAWNTFGFTFQAVSTTMQLKITGFDFPQNNAYIGLDNVSVELAAVTPVPEPEIYAMMGLGLGILGWIGRGKKLQAA